MVSIKLISNKEANMIEKIVNGELEYLYSRLIRYRPDDGIIKSR